MNTMHFSNTNIPNLHQVTNLVYSNTIQCDSLEVQYNCTKCLLQHLSSEIHMSETPLFYKRPLNLPRGQAMAQVSHWPFTAAHLVLPRPILVGYVVDTVAFLLWILSFHQYHSTNASYSYFIHLPPTLHNLDNYEHH